MPPLLPRLARLAALTVAAAAAAAASAVSYYLLPVGDPRCRDAARRLRCLDQSVLLAATDAPDASLLGASLLCNGTAWAALGCQLGDVGALAWRLAFRLTAVPCGWRVVSASSPVNPLVRPWGPGAGPPARVTEFTCLSHAYPHVHRPRYRFTHLAWHRDAALPGGQLLPTAASPAPAALNISASVYAQFRPGLSDTDRRAECGSRDGFWCGGGGGNFSGVSAGCIYGTHRCNGRDDCMDGGAAPANATPAAGVGSDELDCGVSGAAGLFDFWPNLRGGGVGSAPSSGARLALTVATLALRLTTAF